MGSILGVRLPADIDARLERLADETGRTKSFYAKKAIAQFLEDREDYLRGLAALESKEPRISLADLRKDLGLVRRVHRTSRARTKKA